MTDIDVHPQARLKAEIQRLTGVLSSYLSKFPRGQRSKIEQSITGLNNAQQKLNEIVNKEVKGETPKTEEEHRLAGLTHEQVEELNKRTGPDIPLKPVLPPITVKTAEIVEKEIVKKVKEETRDYDKLEKELMTWIQILQSSIRERKQELNNFEKIKQDDENQIKASVSSSLSKTDKIIDILRKQTNIFEREIRDFDETRLTIINIFKDKFRPFESMMLRDDAQKIHMSVELFTKLSTNYYKLIQGDIDQGVKGLFLNVNKYEDILQEILRTPASFSAKVSELYQIINMEESSLAGLSKLVKHEEELAKSINSEINRFMNLIKNVSLSIGRARQAALSRYGFSVNTQSGFKRANNTYQLAIYLNTKDAINGFNYHCEHHDFSRWIAGVLNDHEFAKELEHLENKKDLSGVIKALRKYHDNDYIWTR